jgi:hypothetical protein
MSLGMHVAIVYTFVLEQGIKEAINHDTRCAGMDSVTAHYYPPSYLLVDK